MAYQPKSYRKFIATAATATIVASAVAPAASAASVSDFKDVAAKYQDAVNYLVVNGITQGTSDTTFGTHENVKRGDAAIWLAKALKLDLTNVPASGFSDTGRYDAAVSALKAEGVLSGKTATTYAPNALLTRGEMAKILANAYDLESDAAVPFTDLGPNFGPYIKALYEYEVTQGKTETTFGTSQNITRGDLAIFLKRAAEVVKTPEVSSLTAINATQVEFKFNKAVDAKSIFVNGKSGEFAEGVLSMRSIDGVTNGTLTGELSQDGKVLTVTSTQLLEKRYDVSLDKVKTTNGASVTKFSQIVKIEKDVTAPSIVGTERVTANQVKVKFSEPMASAGSTTFKLSDGTSVTAITGQGNLVDGGKAVVLDLSSSSVPVNKDITATIIGAADKAGNLLNPNPATVTFQKGEKDGVAPTVSSVTQTGAKTFEIKFSEGIVTKPTVSIDNVSVNAENVVIDSSDSTKVTVTAPSVLDGDKIVTITGAVDGSGEIQTTTNRVVKFVKDEAAPTLVSTAVVSDATDKNEYLELTFNKNVNLNNATVDVTDGKYVKDYITTDLQDGDITEQGITYKSDDNKKVLRVKLDTLLGSKDVEGAKYTVDVSFTGVSSEAGVAITTATAEFTRGKDGSLANTDQVTLSSVTQGSTNNTVVVTFDKAVDAASATNVANYIVGGAVVESASVNSENLKVVTLKLKSGSNTFSGYRNVTVQNVKATGSTVTMTTTTKAVDLKENVAPTVTAQLQSDLKTIKLTFSENVFQTANTTPDFGLMVGTDAYTWDDDNNDATPVVAFEKDSGLPTDSTAATNTVNITLQDPVTATQLSKGLSLKALTTIDVKDVAGNKLSVPSNISISNN